MSEVIAKKLYNRLGLDVGFCGRWLRLVVGLYLTGLIVFQVSGTYSVSAGIELVLYFIAILTIYSAAHYLLGERILNKLNPWIGTTLLLGPLVAIFAFQIGPQVLHQAILVYIGISLVVSYFMGYGGCEVVSIPSIFFRRRYTVYCPLNVVDVADKAAVDRKSDLS
jgi:hypothetical protein